MKPELVGGCINHKPQAKASCKKIEDFALQQFETESWPFWNFSYFHQTAWKFGLKKTDTIKTVYGAWATDSEFLMSGRPHPFYKHFLSSARK